MTTCQTHRWPQQWPGHSGHVCVSAPGQSGHDDPPTTHNHHNCCHRPQWCSQGQSQSWIWFRARCNYWLTKLLHPDLVWSWNCCWWKHNNSSRSLPRTPSPPPRSSWGWAKLSSIFCINHKKFHQSPPPSQISSEQPPHTPESWTHQYKSYQIQLTFDDSFISWPQNIFYHLNIFYSYTMHQRFKKWNIQVPKKM